MVRNGARGMMLATVAAVLCGTGALAGTAGAAQLANGRAYELVSPPGKNGADVIQQTNKTHVASDGNAVTFSALGGGFGDLEGTSLDTEYLSRRTGVSGTNGWSTRGINPSGGSTALVPLIAGQSANTPTYVDAFTPDLSAAIYRSWRSLTNAPNVATVTNLYRITGLDEPSASVHLMSNAVVAPLLPSWPAVMAAFHFPQFAGASSDLSHVVFESTLALTADAAPYQGFLCVLLGFTCTITQLYESDGGFVRLVNRIPSNPADMACDDVNGPACVPADSGQTAISTSLEFYSQRAISEDGRRIFFQVPGSGAIYMRQDGTRTVRVADNGVFGTASTDGSRVFFTTSDSLLPSQDIDANPDLYMYDTNTGNLTLVSASRINDGTASTVIGASADGRYVYFVCTGQLVADEPPADFPGLYVWHNGTLAYVGHLVDNAEGQVNGSQTKWGTVSSMRTSRITPDGRNLLFMTRSDVGFRGRGGFAGYDHAGRQELYLYSADTKRLVCASCNPNGRVATADAVTNVRTGAAASAATSDQSHALSDDGQHVFFTTAEALVSEDKNGTSDAYEYNVARASVHLLSSGTDPSASYLIDASNDGRDAFFGTRERLLRWDVDDSYDLYDARVGGGFPEPMIAAPPCTADACLDPGTTAPENGTAGSAQFRGAGNTGERLKRRSKRCAPRKVLRHVRGKKRCVRRKAHRRAKPARLEGADGVRHSSAR